MIDNKREIEQIRSKVLDAIPFGVQKTSIIVALAEVQKSVADQLIDLEENLWPHEYIGKIVFIVPSWETPAIRWAETKEQFVEKLSEIVTFEKVKIISAELNLDRP